MFHRCLTMRPQNQMVKGFFFISNMKVCVNFPKAKHQALKNTIEMSAEEEIITLIVCFPRSSPSCCPHCEGLIDCPQDHRCILHACMLNANKATSVANFTVVILDVAVVQAWDPGDGWKWGWGDWRVCCQGWGRRRLACRASPLTSLCARWPKVIAKERNSEAKKIAEALRQRKTSNWVLRYFEERDQNNFRRWKGSQSGERKIPPSRNHDSEQLTTIRKYCPLLARAASDNKNSEISAGTKFWDIGEPT